MRQNFLLNSGTLAGRLFLNRSMASEAVRVTTEVNEKRGSEALRLLGIAQIETH